MCVFFFFNEIIYDVRWLKTKERYERNLLMLIKRNTLTYMSEKLIRIISIKNKSC